MGDLSQSLVNSQARDLTNNLDTLLVQNSNGLTLVSYSLSWQVSSGKSEVIKLPKKEKAVATGKASQGKLVGPTQEEITNLTVGKDINKNEIEIDIIDIENGELVTLSSLFYIAPTTT